MFCSSRDIPDLDLELVSVLLCLLSYAKENYILACMQNQANTSLLPVHGVSKNSRGFWILQELSRITKQALS